MPEIDIGKLRIAMLIKKIVIYEKGEYYITGLVLRIIDEKLKWLVELHDLRANSIRSAELNKIEGIDLRKDFCLEAELEKHIPRID